MLLKLNKEKVQRTIANSQSNLVFNSNNKDSLLSRVTHLLSTTLTFSEIKHELCTGH